MHLRRHHSQLKMASKLLKVQSILLVGLKFKGFLWGQEEFEDTKVVIRIRMSKERQYNGQTKQKKTMIYKTLHRKLTIKHHKPHEDWG